MKHFAKNVDGHVNITFFLLEIPLKVVITFSSFLSRWIKICFITFINYKNFVIWWKVLNSTLHISHSLLYINMEQLNLKCFQNYHLYMHINLCCPLYPGFSKWWSGLGGIRNFTGGGGLLGEQNLRSSDFDNSNLFQS